MIRRIWLVVPYFIAASAFAAQEEDVRIVVERALNGYILPAYQRLNDETKHLVSAIDRYCERSDPEIKGTLEASFAGVVTAWAGVDFLRFGPMAQESRYERFFFFPDVHGTGTRQLRRFLTLEDRKLLRGGAIAKESAAVQGLPALESLLYSGPKALISTDPPERFRCELARTISRNLDNIATDAVIGWQAADGWTSLLASPSVENPVYRTHAEAMTEIFKALLTGLEQMRDHRLLPALGEAPEKARASKAPLAVSRLTFQYLSASADALDRYVEVSGILELAPGGQIADSILLEFQNLRDALRAAGSDLEVAIEAGDKRDTLVYATVVLATLRGLFQNRLAQAAGLTPGFNSLDGD